MQEIINQAADLIAKFNPQLAKAWMSQPFNRVNLAYAFAAGFAKSETDDINENAALVIRVALLDREMRMEAA
jgi:hypothetical protein